MPPSQQYAAERLVEIDRLLARPLTGRPDEANQRSMLRAERESLIASGQVPYSARNSQAAQSMVNHHAQTAQSTQSTLTRRSANGEVVNYATENNSGGAQVIVAPNSQDRDLPFLEQMTPTERAHYYRDQAIRNRGRYEVDVYHHHQDNQVVAPGR